MAGVAEEAIFHAYFNPFLGLQLSCHYLIYRQFRFCRLLGRLAGLVSWRRLSSFLACLIQVKGQKGNQQPKAKPGVELESKSADKSKTSAVITDVVILQKASKAFAIYRGFH